MSSSPIRSWVPTRQFVQCSVIRMVCLFTTEIHSVRMLWPDVQHCGQVSAEHKQLMKIVPEGFASGLLM